MNFIYKTLPRHTSEKVPLDQVIEIFFMIDMNKQAMKDSHIVLFNLTEQEVEPVTFEYNRRLLKIKPASKLLPSNHYQLQLVGGKEGFRDITGRFMPETYELEFKTKDIESMKPPVILSPTDRTVVRDKPEFHLEPAQNAIYYELQVSKSNTFHNVVWPYDGEKVYQTAKLQIIPDIEYERRNYYVRVRSSDAEGNKSAWSPIVQFYFDNAPIIELPEDPEIPEESETPEDPIVEYPEPEEPEPEEPDIEDEDIEEEIEEEDKNEEEADDDAEEEIEEDIEEGDDPEDAEEDEVILQSNTRLHSEGQLSELQAAFVNQSPQPSQKVTVVKSSPKDKSVNNRLDKINQVVIEFTEPIDPSSVDEDTCYLLTERN